MMSWVGVFSFKKVLLRFFFFFLLLPFFSYLIRPLLRHPSVSRWRRSTRRRERFPVEIENFSQATTTQWTSSQQVREGKRSKRERETEHRRDHKTTQLGRVNTYRETARVFCARHSLALLMTSPPSRVTRHLFLLRLDSSVCLCFNNNIFRLETERFQRII